MMAGRISKIWNLSRLRTRVRATPWTCCKTILNSMIGWKRLRVRDRQPRVDLNWGRLWLLVGVTACAVAHATPPPPPPPSQSQSPGASQPPPPGAPDDDFIEFLGTDDVGDAAWWEFLKRVPPRGGNPPATPPQEGK